MWQMSLPFGASKGPRRPVVDVEKAPEAPRRPLKLLADLRPDWQRDPNRGPGPSRVVYRLRRAWAKAWVRQTVRIAVPLGVAGVVIWQAGSDPVIREQASHTISHLFEQVSSRPEFSVHGFLVEGASDDIRRLIGETVDLGPDASSLSVDVAAVKAQVEALGQIARADVILDPQGILRISVVERVPVVLWRDGDDRLWLVDDEGVAAAPAATRAGYPDLPILLGEDAPRAVAEALELIRANPDLTPRLRAMVRVGKRRWNLVLDRDVTIMLPESDPSLALAHVMALHYGEEVLDRDLVAVDMRVPHRPTLRLTGRGVEAFRVIQAVSGGTGEDT